MLFAADMMLREPKTMTAEASVAEVREQLANPKVQMVLLADGGTFKGAVTHVPRTPRRRTAPSPTSTPNPRSSLLDASADEAFERAAASPNRRVIVLDEDDNLLGLLCLNQTAPASARRRKSSTSRRVAR